MLSLILAVAVLEAGQNGIDLKIDADRTEIDPGRSVFLTVTMKVPADVKASMPDIRDRARGFSVAEEFPGKPVKNADGSTVETANWRLVPEPCAETYKIAPFAVTASPRLLSSQADEGALSFVAGPVYFGNPPARETVTGGMEADPTKDLPPLSWKLVGWCLAALSAAAVVLAGAVMLVSYVARRVREHRMSPIERAWVELDRLLKKGLPGRGRYKDFYVELTMVVRRYVQRKYGIKAPHLTTDEFFAEIGAKGMRSDDLMQFLESADLVKFAGVQATPEMADGATDSARRYLRSDSAAVASLLAAVAVFACSFGAGAGVQLDVQREIDAAAAKGGGTVRIPAGEHEVRPFVLKSNITLELADGATIRASRDIADYATDKGCPVFIYAEYATNLTIVGSGTIDGRGGGFRETARLRGEDQPKTLPVLMRFSRCRNLRLEGFKYTNPGSWACHLRNCDGVKVKGVRCYNYCNRMNDGIDIESCNVTVEDCEFYADDDSFCFKAESDKSFPVTNVVVRNCKMGSVCNAIKFGTGSYCDFRDILIENCELRRSPGAFRWDWRKRGMPGVTKRHCGIAGLALEVVDGGRMENVTIRNVTMEGYMTPIFIRHHHRHEPKDGKVDTYLRNVLIENVRGTADGRIASSITGVPAKGGASARRPRDITLRNVSLTVPGGGTEAEAKAAVPEKDGAYPEAFMFSQMALPAYGFYVRHADNVVFDNVEVRAASPDARPRLVVEDGTFTEK